MALLALAQPILYIITIEKEINKIERSARGSAHTKHARLLSSNIDLPTVLKSKVIRDELALVSLSIIGRRKELALMCRIRVCKCPILGLQTRTLF